MNTADYADLVKVILELALHLNSFDESDGPLRIGNDDKASAYDMSTDMIATIRRLAGKLDTEKINPAPLSHAMRLKLDKRIHTQRMSLRQNWEIIEQREKWINQSNRQFVLQVLHLCDVIGIPRNEGTSMITGWERLRRLETHLGVENRPDVTAKE